MPERKAPYLTMPEAAARLGISRERVRQHIDDGRLSFVWTADGSQRLIPVAALKDFKPRPSGRPRKSSV